MRHAAAKAIAITALVLVPALAAAQENQLPPGPGRAEVIAACSDCHGLSAVIYNRRTAQEWTDILEQMQIEGSNIQEQKIPLMVQYLVAHFGSADQPAPSQPVPDSGPAAK